MSEITIQKVRDAVDLAAVADLFREFAASLPIKLDYQGFEEELAALPGKYVPPQGEIFLAKGAAGEVYGCVAVRPLGDGICEMKRMYVRPSARGMGVGRRLGEAILAWSREAGYREMYLDTHVSLTAAKAMYLSLGFTEIPPYNESPYGELLFFSRPL